MSSELTLPSLPLHTWIPPRTRLKELRPRLTLSSIYQRFNFKILWSPVPFNELSPPTFPDNLAPDPAQYDATKPPFPHFLLPPLMPATSLPNPHTPTRSHRPWTLVPQGLNSPLDPALPRSTRHRVIIPPVDRTNRICRFPSLT